MEKTEPRDTVNWPSTGIGAFPEGSIPPLPPVEQPVPLAVVAPRSLVAPRVTFSRRPPEMALTWDAPAQPVASISNPDVALVSSLPTPQLAFRLAVLAAKIETQVEYGGTPEALMGLGVLSRQAQMYEHLHILQCTSGEVG